MEPWGLYSFCRVKFSPVLCRCLGPEAPTIKMPLFVVFNLETLRNIVGLRNSDHGFPSETFRHGWAANRCETAVRNGPRVLRLYAHPSSKGPIMTWLRRRWPVADGRSVERYPLLEPRWPVWLPLLTSNNHRQAEESAHFLVLPVDSAGGMKCSLGGQCFHWGARHWAGGSGRTYRALECFWMRLKRQRFPWVSKGPECFPRYLFNEAWRECGRNTISWCGRGLSLLGAPVS